MRIELRKFKHKEFLLLLPENPQEEFALDMLGTRRADAPPIQLKATVQSDDFWNPYIKIEIP